jgi:hypothetical protein
MNPNKPNRINSLEDLKKHKRLLKRSSQSMLDLLKSDFALAQSKLTQNNSLQSASLLPVILLKKLSVHKEVPLRKQKSLSEVIMKEASSHFMNVFMEKVTNQNTWNEFSSNSFDFQMTTSLALQNL